MRDYGKVSPRFWTGTTGKKIRDAGGDSQRVALYLITCPLSNMIGLYYLPLPTLAHEVGISLQGACKALGSLSEALFCHYDEESETVWVPEMAAHQLGERLEPKDNRVKGVHREWESMRKCPFYKDFYQRYRTAYHLPEPTKNESPLEAPWKPLGSQEQEQEQEQEKEQDLGEVSPKPPPRARKQKRIPTTAKDVLNGLAIPPELNTPAAIEAVREWLEHKDRIRKQYASRESFLVELRRWAKIGPERFACAVAFSIGKEWQGIYEEPTNGRSATTGGNRRSTADGYVVGPGQRYQGPPIPGIETGTAQAEGAVPTGAENLPY